MAITENADFPRLTPPEERMPSGSRLFRRAEELTDDQFDLLAAAWAENALSGEALAELEAVMTADTRRMERALSFHNIRLTPGKETWPGLSSAIKPSPVLTAFRRTIIPAILAVAAMIVIIIYGPAGAKLKTINTGNIAAESGMTIAEIQAPSPIIAVDGEPVTRRGAAAVSQVPVTRAGAVEISQTTVASDMADPVMPEVRERAQPLALAWSYETAAAVATAINPGMTPVSLREISPTQPMTEEKNWMLRSVSFLAGALTGKEQRIDGYALANGCITGINTVLGWDMELEQVSNSSGEPVAVSFNSSLLSFTKPVNKTTP